MNHYVYEITDLTNGKKYIGKRSCKCDIENDKYMGSGKLIKKVVKEKGIKNFSKRVIHVCKNKHEALKKEALEIKERDAANSEFYYNIAGEGRKRKVPITIRLEGDLTEKVLEKMAKEGKNASHVLNELIELGLTSIEDPLKYEKYFGNFLFCK